MVQFLLTATVMTYVLLFVFLLKNIIIRIHLNRQIAPKQQMIDLNRQIAPKQQMIDLNPQIVEPNVIFRNRFLRTLAGGDKREF